MKYPHSVRRFAEPYSELTVQTEARHDQVYEFAHDLRNHGRTKDEIKRAVH